MNASKCIDQIPKVIQAAKDNLSARKKLQPLFDAGWGDGDTLANYTIREESPRVWVAANVDQDGTFNIFTGPSDVRCKVKSIAEVVEFAEKLKKAVEEADLK